MATFSFAHAAVTVCALGLAGGWAAPAQATCNLTLRAANIGTVRVRIPLAEVIVRTRLDGAMVWGPWRPAQAGGWYETATHRVLAPGEAIGDTYAADLPCLLARQWRVTFRCLGGVAQGQSFTVFRDIPGRVNAGSDTMRVGGTYCTSPNP